MISTYRLFQLIMGLIFSAFLLYILMSYAGDYASVGEQLSAQKRLDVFLQDVDNVHNTGIPLNFSLFDKDGYSSCQPRPTIPPKMFCYIDEKTHETEQLLTPVLLRPGREMVLYRGTSDHGWTRIDYVLALKTTTFVFNPLDTTETTWNTIADVAGTLPDTAGQSPRITFDLCDGSNLLITSYFNEPYDKRDFIDTITYNREVLAPCTATLASTQVLITISDSCGPNPEAPGVCVRPSDTGVGRMYLSGSGDTYIYKDPLDILSLSLGSQYKNIFNNPIGEETWEYKNNAFNDIITKSAEFMARRSVVIYQLPNITIECRDAYMELSNSLALLSSFKGADSYDITSMELYNDQMTASSDAWSDLESLGCETIGSG